MKRFDAIYKDDSRNNHLISDGKIYTTEVRFDIMAESKERAFELIEKEGENPDDFDMEETSGVKDQMGRYFPESIKDARI